MCTAFFFRGLCSCRCRRFRRCRCCRCFRLRRFRRCCCRSRCASRATSRKSCCDHRSCHCHCHHLLFHKFLLLQFRRFAEICWSRPLQAAFGPRDPMLPSCTLPQKFHRRRFLEALVGNLYKKKSLTQNTLREANQHDPWYHSHYPKVSLHIPAYVLPDNGADPSATTLFTAALRSPFTMRTHTGFPSSPALSDIAS